MLVYDYVDVHIKVLERIYHKRLRGYAELGYMAKGNRADNQIGIIFDTKSSGIHQKYTVFDQRGVGTEASIFFRLGEAKRV